MRLLHLDHVVIRCRDIDAMVAFYCDVLGCELEKRVEALGLVHLRAGGALIDLLAVPVPVSPPGEPPPSPGGRNMEHFCLRIEPFDFEALRAHFGRFGIDPGPVHEHYGAEGRGPSVYLSDPEGNTIELKGPGAGVASAHGAA